MRTHQKMRTALVSIAMLALAACQTTGDPPPNLQRSADGVVSLVLIEPEIEVGLITAGGVFESRADWTTSVTTNVLAALKTEGDKRKLDLTAINLSDLQLDEQQKVEAARKIHRRVALAKAFHELGPAYNLPTKGKRYVALIGKQDIAPVRNLTEHRYAAMLSIRDSYTSGGRAAAIFAAALLFGANVQGGQTQGYLSLVDLETSRIIWQTAVPIQSELRTKDGAKKMINIILDKMQGKANLS